MPSPFRFKFFNLGSNVPNKILIEGLVSIGASGAVTAVTPTGGALGAAIPADGQACPGALFTVTHSATGTYLFTFTETYIRPSYYNAGLRSLTAVGAADTRQVRVRPFDTVNNQLKVEIVDTAAANALVNPASGEVLVLFAEFVGSSVPRT